MGNKWGVIYNTTGKDIVYAIHEKKMEHPFQKINKLKEQDQRSAIASDNNIFTVVANRYSRTGLDKSKNNKYISFQYLDGGKQIKTNHPFPQETNFRVQINKQGIIYLSQKLCEQLQKQYDSSIISDGCSECQSSASYLFQDEAEDLSCMLCCIQNESAKLICSQQSHVICSECSRIRHHQNKRRKIK